MEGSSPDDWRSPQDRKRVRRPHPWPRDGVRPALSARWSSSLVRPAILRAACFLAFWLMIAGRDPSGLPVGVATAIAAAFVSLRLSPPSRSRLRSLDLFLLAFRFARQSVASGFEVAWRALDPRLPLNPGFVAYRLRIAPGGARSAFCAFSSLLPGTLPTGVNDSGELLVHCLDKDQPVVANLAAEEALFMRALGYD